MTDKPLLSSLLQNLPAADVRGPVNVTITGVHHDSRKIKPGNLFVAISGATFDGRDFIPQALERGAAAVVVEGELRGTQGNSGELRGTRRNSEELRAPFVTVPDARSALAHLAAAFYRHPSRRLKVIGVTGPDGKTTT